MREAKKLLRLAKSVMAFRELSLDELKGAVQFSPKWISGKNFFILERPGAIYVRGPHGAEYFREARWRDRYMELGLRDAPQEVQDAFSYFGGNYGKLIRELAKTKAFHMKRIAAERQAVKSRFTVIRPLSLAREGATRDSMENARRLKAAGYALVNGDMTFDMKKAEWQVKAYFFRKLDGSDGVHIFKGFSFGYGGEGPHGLRDFLALFGWSPKEDKIFTHGYFDMERGTVNLKSFT